MSQPATDELAAADFASTRAEIAAIHAQGMHVADYAPEFSANLERLTAEFPDAIFVSVSRNPLQAILSGVQAWESGRFKSDFQPEGWWGTPWSFGLVSTWSSLIGKPIPEIVTEQYLRLANEVNSTIKSLEPDRCSQIAFEDFLRSPAESLQELVQKFGLTFDATLPDNLPQSSRSLPRLAAKRARLNPSEIFVALREREELHKEVRSLWIDTFKTKPVDRPTSDSQNRSVSPRIPKPSDGTAFASSYSQSLVELLQTAKSSIAISTYKSGHLIIASEDEGRINTTFHRFQRPMGIAIAGDKLAVGTKDEIRIFTNQPELANQVEPQGFFEAAYFPRSTSHTGDIAIHEMAFGSDELGGKLWYVNTAFSCLCVLDPNYSFVPVWKPTWITGLAKEDRCHLNGLALVNGAPRYVTALSQTNSARGWRALSGSSGVIVDVNTNRVITSGLSMPHSPRWYREKLWFLESGKGTLSTVDVTTGEVTTVATMPGFTRGLSFIGPFALVGLSQVRESVFKNLPVTNSTEERNCGVWVIDTRSAEIVGVLRFEAAVTEVFDVAVIPNSPRATVIDTGPLLDVAFRLPVVRDNSSKAS